MHRAFIVPQKTTWSFVIFLALLLILIRLPSFDMPLDNDSGANAFFARYMVRGGILYDVFHPAHHLPGIYYTFGFAIRLFGDHPNAPKLLLLPWAFACTLLMYFMRHIYSDEQIGRLAAVFFVLVTSQRGVGGMTVEMEHFANLPLILGFFLLIVLLRQHTRAWQFCLLGLLGAISFLYKAIFVAPLIIAGISILLMAWIDRREIGVWKTMFSRLVWLAIGVIVPLAAVAAYFSSLGLWKRFLLIFELGLHYFSDSHLMNGWMLPPPFGFPLVSMSINNAALLVLGLIGTYRLVRRSIPVRSIGNLTDLAVTLWLVVSFASAGSRGGGFPYYVLLTVPPLALTASIEISTAYQQLKTSSEKSANLIRSASIAMVIVLFLWSNYGLYHDYVTYKLAKISADDFLRSVGEEEHASQEVSDYLKVHTEPSDFIYLWDNSVEVYYYADRLTPIDMFWPVYVGATGLPNRIFDRRTKYIVLDKSENITRPQWLLDGLANSYTLETTIEEREIYRHNPP